ncbi:MAG: hypothetical protein ACM3N5_11485 [Candidatus Eiseniibacteriota bacterium]
MVDQSTDEEVASVVRRSLARLSEAASLDDLEKAVGIAKSAADARKSNTDAQYQAKQLRLESVKSWSAMLVPIVSLLALFATIYVQSIQLQATRQQNEDTQWRDFLNSLKGSSEAFNSDLTAAPRLRSFFESERYGDQAHDIAGQLLGHLSNFIGFKDIYGSIYGSIKSDNVQAIIKLARVVHNTKIAVQVACESAPESVSLLPAYRDIGGVCAPNLNEKQASEIIKSSQGRQHIARLREAYAAQIEQLRFLTQQISSYLRENYATGAQPGSRPGLDLSSLYLISGDFTNVDFSSFDLSNTIFDASEMKDIVLVPEKFSGTEFRASNWWDASSINQKLLEQNISIWYPFYVDEMTFYGPAPTEQHYRSRIAALCAPLKDICRDPKFGNKH